MTEEETMRKSCEGMRKKEGDVQDVKKVLVKKA